MKLVNLTPHAIALQIEGERITLQPSGTLARSRGTAENSSLFAALH